MDYWVVDLPDESNELISSWFQHERWWRVIAYICLNFHRLMETHFTLMHSKNLILRIDEAETTILCGGFGILIHVKDLQENALKQSSTNEWKERGGHWNWCWILSLPHYLFNWMFDGEIGIQTSHRLLVWSLEKCSKEHLQLFRPEMEEQNLTLNLILVTKRSRGGTWLEKHWTFTCVFSQISQLPSWLTHKSGFWVSRLILLKSLTLTSTSLSVWSQVACWKIRTRNLKFWSPRKCKYLFSEKQRFCIFFGMCTQQEHIQLHC